MALTTGAFTVLATIVAIRQMCEAAIGPGAGLAIVTGGAGLGALIGFAMFRMESAASRGLVDTLFASRGLPPAPSFSMQEALCAQGRHREAADAFLAHLAVHPGDHDARLALAAILATPLGAATAAEEQLRLVRDAKVSERQEATARQGLIDLYAATGQTGRQMAELARFADRYPGTQAARAAREAIRRLKASRQDDGWERRAP